MNARASKRWGAVAGTLALLLALAGCGGSSSEREDLVSYEH
jgi:hypothetical protein